MRFDTLVATLVITIILNRKNRELRFDILPDERKDELEDIKISLANRRCTASGGRNRESRARSRRFSAADRLA